MLNQPCLSSTPRMPTETQFSAQQFCEGFVTNKTGEEFSDLGTKRSLVNQESVATPISKSILDGQLDGDRGSLSTSYSTTVSGTATSSRLGMTYRDSLGKKEPKHNGGFGGSTKGPHCDEDGTKSLGDQQEDALVGNQITALLGSAVGLDPSNLSSATASLNLLVASLGMDGSTWSADIDHNSAERDIISPNSQGTQHQALQALQLHLLQLCLPATNSSNEFSDNSADTNNVRVADETNFPFPLKSVQSDWNSHEASVTGRYNGGSSCHTSSTKHSSRKDANSSYTTPNVPSHRSLTPQISPQASTFVLNGSHTVSGLRKSATSSLGNSLQSSLGMYPRRVSRVSGESIDETTAFTSNATASSSPRSLLFYTDGSLRLDFFKVYLCKNESHIHDRKNCPFYHSQRDRRRYPVQYRAEQCEDHFDLDGDCIRTCQRGDRCDKCHNRHELLYHPDIYKQRFCSSYNHLECHRGKFCAFAHTRKEIRCHLFSEDEERDPINIKKSPVFPSEFFMMKFKTLWCPYGVQHDWHGCLYAHTYQDCRRSPHIGYGSEPCPYWQKDLHSADYQKRCPFGPRCPYSHGSKEQLYHPAYYKTMPCADYKTKRSCPRGQLCAFYHDLGEKRPSTGSVHPTKTNGESGCERGLKSTNPADQDAVSDYSQRLYYYSEPIVGDFMKLLQPNFMRPPLFNLDDFEAFGHASRGGSGRRTSTNSSHRNNAGGHQTSPTTERGGHQSFQNVNINSFNQHAQFNQQPSYSHPMPMLPPFPSKGSFMPQASSPHNHSSGGSTSGLMMNGSRVKNMYGYQQVDNQRQGTSQNNIQGDQTLKSHLSARQGNTIQDASPQGSSVFNSYHSLQHFQNNISSKQSPGNVLPSPSFLDSRLSLSRDSSPTPDRVSNGGSCNRSSDVSKFSTLIGCPTADKSEFIMNSDNAGVDVESGRDEIEISDRGGSNSKKRPTAVANDEAVDEVCLRRGDEACFKPVCPSTNVLVSTGENNGPSGYNQRRHSTPHLNLLDDHSLDCTTNSTRGGSYSVVSSSNYKSTGKAVHCIGKGTAGSHTEAVFAPHNFGKDCVEDFGGKDAGDHKTSPKSSRTHLKNEFNPKRATKEWTPHESHEVLPPSNDGGNSFKSSTQPTDSTTVSIADLGPKQNVSSSFAMLTPSTSTSISSTTQEGPNAFLQQSGNLSLAAIFEDLSILLAQNNLSSKLKDNSNRMPSTQSDSNSEALEHNLPNQQSLWPPLVFGVETLVQKRVVEGCNESSSEVNGSVVPTDGETPCDETSISAEMNLASRMVPQTSFKHEGDGPPLDSSVHESNTENDTARNDMISKLLSVVQILQQKQK